MRHLAEGKGKKRDIVAIYARKEGFFFYGPDSVTDPIDG